MGADKDDDSITYEVIDRPSLTYMTRSLTGRVTLSQTSMWPAPPDSCRGASTRTESGNGSAEDSKGDSEEDEVGEDDIGEGELADEDVEVAVGC